MGSLVTTQVVPPVGDLLVLLTLLVFLALMISAAVQVGRGHARPGARLAGMSGARFVIAEGTDAFGPRTLTIGDEVSPFHARTGWPLGRD